MLMVKSRSFPVVHRIFVYYNFLFFLKIVTVILYVCNLLHLLINTNKSVGLFLNMCQFSNDHGYCPKT